MCRLMGSHVHDWIDYNGVAFSIALLEWGRTFSDFWGKAWFSLAHNQKHKDVRTRRMAYLTQFSIPASLNPMINKMADELLFICSHEVWVKVIYDWSKSALCLCPCLSMSTRHRAANLNASALIGQVGLVKHALLFFRSYNLNFHARLFGKQWCINTLTLKLRNIRKYKDCFFFNSKIRKNRSFSVWTLLLTAIFWTVSPAFIFSRAVKERWVLSRTESVLIFKIGKR